MTVNVPFTDLSSYPSPTSAPLSDTNSMDAIPSDVLEFFKVKAPVCVPVVNRKSPSVPLEMVSELPKVISFPVTDLKCVQILRYLYGALYGAPGLQKAK